MAPRYGSRPQKSGKIADDMCLRLLDVRPNRSTLQVLKGTPPETTPNEDFGSEIATWMSGGSRSTPVANGIMSR